MNREGHTGPNGAMPSDSEAKLTSMRESHMSKLKRLADEVAEELPKELFRELNGGIVIAERTKRHRQSDPRQPLYVLGEYNRSSSMGRYIILYGGSILRLYGRLSDEQLKAELRRIIRHEFTHHIESLSGVRDLGVEDEKMLMQYKCRFSDPHAD